MGFFSVSRNELKITAIHQIKYATDQDFALLDMSRPEQRRLRKFYDKYCSQGYLSKIKRLLQTPVTTNRRDEVCLRTSFLFEQFYVSEFFSLSLWHRHRMWITWKRLIRLIRRRATSTSFPSTQFASISNWEWVSLALFSRACGRMATREFKSPSNACAVSVCRAIRWNSSRKRQSCIQLIMKTSCDSMALCSRPSH